MRGLNFRIILGLVILIAGVLWLLQDFNLIDTAALNLWSYWPLIPLIVGLDWLVLSFRTSGSSSGKRVFFSWGQFVSALIMMGIGVLYLGRNMGLIDAAIVNRFWQILLPVLLIFLGFSLLRKRGSGRGSNRLAFMGGVDIGQKSWKLESGNYLAFMGGIKLDLTRAEIGREEIILDLTAFMGGIDVKIP
ncbi:MAG: LiaF domain-containing protein, partial [Dethiobacteria bacterium]